MRYSTSFSFTTFCLHFPCPLYAKWCKCFLGDQGESLLAVSLSLYYEKKCCGIRGSTLFHSGFDGVEAMSLFTYLFCFLLSFVCCQCPWHWLLHQQTYFQNLFFSESILFFYYFFFPFSLCKGYVLALWNPCSKLWMMYELKNLCLVHSRNTESAVQSLLCSAFFYIYRHTVVISYSFRQALYVQTPWDGMACVPLACNGIYIREIFVHNCSLCCAQKKVVPFAFANMPAWGFSSVEIPGSKNTWEALLRCLYFANVCSERDLNPR